MEVSKLDTDTFRNIDSVGNTHFCKLLQIQMRCLILMSCLLVQETDSVSQSLDGLNKRNTVQTYRVSVLDSDDTSRSHVTQKVNEWSFSAEM